MLLDLPNHSIHTTFQFKKSSNAVLFVVALIVLALIKEDYFFRVLIYNIKGVSRCLSVVRRNASTVWMGNNEE